MRPRYNGMETYLQVSSGTVWHRCPVCWPDTKHAHSDNGFIPESERYEHAPFCVRSQIENRAMKDEGGSI